MLYAFIDESARRRRGEETCVYSLAAVLVDAAVLDVVREGMDRLRYKKAPRVHWRDERPERKKVIAASMADMPIAGLITTCLHDVQVKSERARRLCLNRLLPELSDRGVGMVTFESRQLERDHADRAVLTALRKTPLIRSEMEVSWLQGSADPGLWTADVLAGSVSWWLDGVGQYWQLLESRATIIEIDP